MPTRTWPPSSMRAHSCDFWNFRSPGISLMVGSWLSDAGDEPVILTTTSGRMQEPGTPRRGRQPLHPACRALPRSNPLARFAVAHERRLHRAQRQLAPANVHAQSGVRTRGHAREADGLAQRGRKDPRQDFAVAPVADHALAVAQHALVVQHHANQFARHARGLLPLQRGAADEIAAFVQRHGPREPGLPGRHVLVHVLAVQVHPRFEPQGVARAQTGGAHARRGQRVPQRHRVGLRHDDLEAILAGVAGARHEQRHAARTACLGGGELAQLLHALAVGRVEQAQHPGACGPCTAIIARSARSLTVTPNGAACLSIQARSLSRVAAFTTTRNHSLSESTLPCADSARRVRRMSGLASASAVADAPASRASRPWLAPSARKYTIRSSITPPRSFSMHEYSALPGFFSLSTLFASRCRRKSRQRAPCRSTTVMCETSNMPASRRTAWCSSICEP